MFNSELCPFSFQFQNVQFEKKFIFKIVHFLDYILSHAVWKHGRSFLTNALPNKIFSAILFKTTRLGYNFASKRAHALAILNLNFDQKGEKKKGDYKNIQGKLEFKKRFHILNDIQVNISLKYICDHSHYSPW
jgi:hypothetical protein